MDVCLVVVPPPYLQENECVFGWCPGFVVIRVGLTALCAATPSNFVVFWTIG